MSEFYNRHYILTRPDGAITDAWSDGPHPEKDTTNTICINEEGGYQLRLYLFYPVVGTMRTEENPPIYTMDGIPLYKWDGNKIIPRTEDEIQSDRDLIPPPPPTELEKLRSDVDYIALIKDVKL